MPLSKVDICNMALSNVGTQSTIEDIDEESAEAAQCRVWYDRARRQALEAYPWSFAKTRLVLAEDAEDPPEGLWGFRYQYPADCIAAREIENPAGPTADAVPFTVEMTSDKSRRSILCNLEDATLIYTYDNDTPSTFSEHFVETLAYLLGSKIATSLTGNRQIKVDLFNAYRGMIAVAPAQNANEGVEPPPREAEWVRGRV